MVFIYSYTNDVWATTNKSNLTSLEEFNKSYSMNLITLRMQNFSLNVQKL